MFQNSSENYETEIGICAQKGRRPTMEDTHQIIEVDGIIYVGVYDGHGGIRASNLVKDELHKKILLSLKPGDEESSIKKAFQEFDEEVVQKSLSEGRWTDGTCVVNVIITGSTAFISGIGDSEACLYKETEEVVNLTTTHNPTGNSPEIDRIRSLGGRVFFGRVEGILAVSRAIGDSEYKIPQKPQNYVSAIPYVKRIELDSTCKFIIMACDGLWDVCDHDCATKLVNNWLADGKTSQKCSELLVKYALDNDSTDNVTASVIVFHWKNNFSKMPVRSHSVEPPINELPKWVKLLPEVLDQSYFYMNENQADFCASKLGINCDFPCWVSQEIISRALFGENGVKSLRQVESFRKTFFVWAPEFSNVHTTFAYDEKPITINGEIYQGPEQYFQLQKSVGTCDEEKAKLLMKTATPDQAYGIGRNCQMRFDWEQRKDDVMYTTLYAKFSQYNDLKKLLLTTGSHQLVQLKPNDPYWGTGFDGSGLNRLGEILMKIRNVIFCRENY